MSIVAEAVRFVTILGLTGVAIAVLLLVVAARIVWKECS